MVDSSATDHQYCSTFDGMQQFRLKFWKGKASQALLVHKAEEDGKEPVENDLRPWSLLLITFGFPLHCKQTFLTHVCLSGCGTCVSAFSSPRQNEVESRRRMIILHPPVPPHADRPTKKETSLSANLEMIWTSKLEHRCRRPPKGLVHPTTHFAHVKTATNQNII